jgi:hypothetical protein
MRRVYLPGLDTSRWPGAARTAAHPPVGQAPVSPQSGPFESTICNSNSARVSKDIMDSLHAIAKVEP